MPSQTRLFIYLIISAVIFVHPMSSLGQSGDQKAIATGSISGRVTVGTKAAANVPVGAFALEMFSRRRPVAKATTDSDGRFRLTGLPPAQYQIGALAPDLTAAEQNQRSDFGDFFPTSKSVTLAAGENVEDIDLKLVRGGVITGRITDVNNKPVIEEGVMLEGLDENGKPLPTRRRPFSADMYQTDDRGIYRIYGVPAGRYRVSVGIESGGGMNYNTRGFYVRTYYPDTPEQSKARVIELGEGAEVSNIDIRLGQKEETYRATGSVVDAETGQPVAGARVSYLVAPQSPERNSPYLIGSATGPRGEFQINGLTPGRYGAYISSEYDGGEYYSETTYFEVVDKDVTGVEIKATRGLTVSGVVVTEDGAPQSFDRLRISASVTQTPRTENTSGGMTTVGPDGRFRIGGLRPGRVALFVYPGVPSTSRPAIARVERADGGVRELDLQPGQPLNDLRVVLSVGRGAIRGSVKFEGGTLPPDSRLIVRCSLEGRREAAGSNVDARGHFLIKDLRPGTYELTLFLLGNVTTAPQGSDLPHKQFVQVTNDTESQVTFVVDLTPKVRP